MKKTRVTLKESKPRKYPKKRSHTTVDMTDDWMNPKPMQAYVSEAPKNEMEYLIERERRIICFGNPGSITQWEVWDKYTVKKERDKALQRLSKEHPMWHLRARDRNPYMEQIRRGAFA